MRDPFFPAPVSVARTTRPLATYLALTTLPLHIHEILPSFCLYEFLYNVASPRVSTYLFPSVYPKLSAPTKRNWNCRVVSLIQSVFISGVTLWIMYVDTDRQQMDWRQRVWGYSGATGMVQAFSVGYFLWDLGISFADIDIHGTGALAHAASALAISLMGFRPFVNYYGLSFVLYELSTPFLNIHWFCDKLGLTGSIMQLINGIFLVITFGCSRLLWGTYQSIRMYQDVWRALKTPEELSVPAWLAVAYVASSTLLSGLNFYWFGKMVSTVRSRFTDSGALQDKKDR